MCPMDYPDDLKAAGLIKTHSGGKAYLTLRQDIYTLSVTSPSGLVSRVVLCSECLGRRKQNPKWGYHGLPHDGTKPLTCADCGALNHAAYKQKFRSPTRSKPGYRKE